MAIVAIGGYGALKALYDELVKQYLSKWHESQLHDVLISRSGPLTSVSPDFLYARKTGYWLRLSIITVDIVGAMVLVVGFGIYADGSLLGDPLVATSWTVASLILYIGPSASASPTHRVRVNADVPQPPGSKRNGRHPISRSAGRCRRTS